MRYKNLFFSLFLGLSLSLSAADNQDKAVTKEIKIKQDTIRITTTESRPAMKKAVRVENEKTNWTKIKDLFM